MVSYPEVPDEIHLDIFAHLSIPDILALADSCRKMRSLTQSATLKTVIYQFERSPGLSDDAKANISQLSVYWTSRLMIALTEQHVIWIEHLTNTKDERLARLEEYGIRHIGRLRRLEQNVDDRRLARLEDYGLWYIERLRRFTQRGASFALHWSTGATLQRLFFFNPAITPVMRFMIENGASFTNTPLSIHKLLQRCMYERKSGQLTQLLLDQGARYQLIPGGAGYHFQLTWMNTIETPGIDPIHIVLMLNAGVQPATVPLGLRNLLIHTFTQCDDLEWVQLLLDLGVKWTDVEAPLCDILEVAWRELRSPRRRQFLEDNGGALVNTGEWRTSDFIRRAIYFGGENIRWTLPGNDM